MIDDLLFSLSLTFDRILLKSLFILLKIDGFQQSVLINMNHSYFSFFLSCCIERSLLMLLNIQWLDTIMHE